MIVNLDPTQLCTCAFCTGVVCCVHSEKRQAHLCASPITWSPQLGACVNKENDPSAGLHGCFFRPAAVMLCS